MSGVDSLPMCGISYRRRKQTDGIFRLKEEAKILHKTFSGSSLDELNETIEGLRNGDPLLDIEKRYVYDHNGSIYAFGFKTSSKFLQAGSTVKYKIRLVCSAHYDAG